MLTVYQYLAGVKLRGTLTGSNFVKLASLPGMVSKSLQKIDYDLIFRKLTYSNSQSKHMDFYLFIESLEEISRKIYD